MNMRKQRLMGAGLLAISAAMALEGLGDFRVVSVTAVSYTHLTLPTT